MLYNRREVRAICNGKGKFCFYEVLNVCEVSQWIQINYILYVINRYCSSVLNFRVRVIVIVTNATSVHRILTLVNVTSAIFVDFSVDKFQ
jgi:hypothetical protein